MVTMADIASDRAIDPDAQAAVTDFLDYTEYLPSDLIRSLTLIRGLDETYLSKSSALHDLTKLYGSLPSLPPASRPDGQDLRLKISTHLDEALNARESAYAEACRLFDVADRHQNRLKSIIAKLHAIPKPPSRDPTPQPPSSAHAKRSRSGRKLESGPSTIRLKLNPPRGTTVAGEILHRSRARRRITVPGEVMPPFDPDSPIASTEVSDWESPPPSPPRPVLKLKQPKPPPKEKPVTAEKPRPHREPIVPYRKPTPPPEDAEIGSKYRPWIHLTEYEMFRLRKKMKKNHTWEPSEVMIRRELAERGRGWDNYYRAKAEAQANGTKFIDIGNDEKPQVKPDKPESPLPPPSASATPAPKPKPVKKAEAKKESSKEKAREQAALAAQEAELAARRLGDIGSAFKNLFSPLSTALASLNRGASTPTVNGSGNAGKKTTTAAAAATPTTIVTDKPSHKRKADDTGTSASPSAEPDHPKKKQKTAPKPSPLASSPLPANEAQPSAGIIKIPLKLNIAPPRTASSGTSTPAPTTRAASVQRSSVAPKTESTPPLPSRPPSRRSAAASVEPSNAPATPGPAAHQIPAAEPSPKATGLAVSHRAKRDAPGTVMQSSQDGGAAVSVSKRMTKPSKQAKTGQIQRVAATDPALPQIRIDVDGRQEIVDPDEERYCICGDVSWGEMICCELDEKVSLPLCRHGRGD